MNLTYDETKKVLTVFNPQHVNSLLKSDFELVRIEKSRKEPDRDVYIFRNSAELISEMNLLLNGGKKEENVGNKTPDDVGLSVGEKKYLIEILSFKLREYLSMGANIEQLNEIIRKLGA